MTYNYDIQSVDRVVDGDTCDLTLSARYDFGFRVAQTGTYSGRFRLIIVDTPERGQPDWLAATDFARAWLRVNSVNLIATTYKADSFGRWLVDIYTPVGASLSSALLEAGYARYVP